jgi:hypothetical protein
MRAGATRGSVRAFAAAALTRAPAQVRAPAVPAPMVFYGQCTRGFHGWNRPDGFGDQIHTCSE